MSYVDGVVAAVPNANKEAFREHALKSAEIFKKHGALKIVECWGEDVPEGKVTSFTMAVQRKDDESIVFSWIVWPSKEARNKGWEQVMADPVMAEEGQRMPFDGQRMIFGGFDLLVDA